MDAGGWQLALRDKCAIFTRNALFYQRASDKFSASSLLCVMTGLVTVIF
jgi:hypothetical protein